jgi:lipopolysaccharide transport protein LptA/LPS export ABC transporter protein LptC
VPEKAKQTDVNFRFRSRLPRIVGITALLGMAAVVAALLFTFYQSRSNSEFRMKRFPVALSKDVMATINGYERREMDGERVLYHVRADKATTFADLHQELENVHLEVFAADGSGSDKIAANKAVYIPAEEKNFTAYFAGKVDISTRDGLNVLTEQLTYTKADEKAFAEEIVTFSRGNLKGTAGSADLDIAHKRITLVGDVTIEAVDEPQLAGAKYVKLVAGRAAYDHAAEVIELTQSVSVFVSSPGSQTHTNADRATVGLAIDGSSRDVKVLELFDNVSIRSEQSGGSPIEIRSAYAKFEKPEDRFHLSGAVNTVGPGSTRTAAERVFYDRGRKRFELHGDARIERDTDSVAGNEIGADLHDNGNVRYATVNGNSRLRHVTAERAVEVQAPRLQAEFDQQQLVRIASATGQSKVVIDPKSQTEYSQAVLNAASGIDLSYRSPGLLDRIDARGRSTIDLAAPVSVPNGSSKKLSANGLRAFMHSNGADIRRTEAVGDAKLDVIPVANNSDAYRSSVSAARFDCDFFDTGNNARSCVAVQQARLVRTLAVPRNGRGTQTLAGSQLTAHFRESDRELDRVEAAGDAKFTELDRHASAQTMTLTTADEMVRLRGNPLAWDGRSRAKAVEIDWDTRNERSFMRGGVSTTYSDPGAAGGAAPFGGSDKPFFLTSQNAEFDHRGETALYTGDARGWQENNYVRADRLLIVQRESRLQAEGNVQSMLYDAKRRDGGREANVPVYAAADRMTYDANSRLLRYEKNVDIRQGADRLSGGIANVYLNAASEVERTEMEGRVVITQPRRRANADRALYNAADETVVLNGSVRVEDADNGYSEGSRMTVHLRHRKVIGEGGTEGGSPGRTRTVYRIK